MYLLKNCRSKLIWWNLNNIKSKTEKHDFDNLEHDILLHRKSKLSESSTECSLCATSGIKNLSGRRGILFHYWLSWVSVRSKQGMMFSSGKLSKCFWVDPGACSLIMFTSETLTLHTEKLHSYWICGLQISWTFSVFKPC